MFKKHGKQCIGKSKGGWNTKLHMVSADDKTIIEMHLSGGNKHDAPEGRFSIEKIGNEYKGIPYLMDKAYEGDKTRNLVIATGTNLLFLQRKTAGILGNMILTFIKEET